ncbi:MAG: TIGR00730 family Rossman fold protein [Solobacterium sp.]|nr:TIGR00730 family Rossman fold protein [Solobacterium sp.]
MNITVYLGSNPGNNPLYLKWAEEIGSRIGAAGHTMIYGGANDGLMGAAANAVKANGGRVIGVIPGFFAHRSHNGLDQLIAVTGMPERKQKMMEMGDAFLALPGGPGTLEEISEVISALRIGLISCPCVIFSPDGYYDDLKHLYEKMTAEGFLRREELTRVVFAETVEEVMRALGCRKE